jgi:acyl carrier protein
MVIRSPNHAKIQSLALTVHRRNGGTLTALDSSLRLLDPVLGLDSLDLAEIMVAVEKECGVSPFEAATPPRTWSDIIDLVDRQTRP